MRSIRLQTFDTGGSTFSRAAQICGLLGLVACGRSPATRAAPEPAADRSDGQIPTLRVGRVADGTIRLDGRLDEPAWQRAASTGGFVHPGTGRPEPASQVPAHAKMLWDRTNLYVAVVVHDADPSSPFARTETDPHIWERSSAIELMLQPGDPNDNRDYFEIQIDVNDARWETRFDDYNRPITTGPGGARLFGHQEWAANLRTGIRVEREIGRYVIEFALPWTSLTNVRTPVPPNVGDVWRMNLYSFRDGQRDSLAWSPLVGQGNFHRASRFGRVIFE